MKCLSLIDLGVRICAKVSLCFRFDINLLRIISTPWEITLSGLLSIVSDFEREGHLRYKRA